MRDTIKIVNGALDETTDGEIVLRGVIDPDSLKQLQVPSYQREVLPLSKISQLVKALETGTVPDIELGMRGGDYSEREGAFYLKPQVFIIDGLQRVTAGKVLLQKGGDVKPRIGATIRFGTTEDWERERFRILNAERTKLSPNVLLRNMAKDNQAVDMLFRLSHDTSFVMQKRICWTQNMQRGQLITATTFLKIVGMLHAHAGPGKSQRVEEVASGLEKIMSTVGRQILRDNVKTFYGVLDECWGVREVAFTEGAVHLRQNFLRCLAKLFSEHDLFWKGGRLTVDRDFVRKLTLFPVRDPQVGNLAGGGTQAGLILYQLLIEHVNSGKRTRRLVARDSSSRANGAAESMAE